MWLLISTFTLNLKDVFLETHNLILSILAVNIIFGFYFRLNIFTSKITNLLVPLGADDGGGCES